MDCRDFEKENRMKADNSFMGFSSKKEWERAVKKVLKEDKEGFEAYCRYIDCRAAGLSHDAAEIAAMRFLYGKKSLA